MCIHIYRSLVYLTTFKISGHEKQVFHITDHL